MALWDFSQIKSYVRSLTQKKGSSLSDSDLETAINRYYYYKFPLEVQPTELMDWYEFNTTASDDDYTFDDDTGIILQAPAYIDNQDARLWLDPEAFYDRFPQNSTYTEARPSDILFYGGELILRNPPDAVYAVKIKCLVRPTTLTSDTQTPTREEWGSIIAYGTAIELLTADRNFEAANLLKAQYEQHKSTVQQRAVQQLYSGRVKGSF